MGSRSPVAPMVRRRRGRTRSVAEVQRGRYSKSRTTRSIALRQDGHAIRPVFCRISTGPSSKGMGTTFVALAIAPASMPVAHIAHLGDSRAYLYRAGQLQQLTRDHTLVEKLVQRGLIDAATALTHPERHILTKGLGMGVDLKPELTSTPITPQDLIVLCSDGLTKMLEDAAIASVLSRARGDPNQACHDLIEQALNRGGEDNVTVIV